MISNINSIQESSSLELENKVLNNFSNDYKNLSSPQVLAQNLSNYTCSSPDLYANNNNSESITVYNKGAYVAFLSWGYYLNGQYCNFESPYIPVLQSYKITIPTGATGINLLALISIDFSDFDIICRREYATPCTKCLYLWGTLFYYGCSEMPCPSNIVEGSPIPPGNTVPDCN
ncbi:hypothetical protein IRP63_04745 [Clostridium botulinum]|uniref:Uncharacterized protein n=1 Tax=Clostridium botulinum C/D str. DC5 TaxID=1443128 RepID=A0A0A0II11_CLOBO|nr:hypothetical protein [Clostridium botulinum]KGM95038.1 hypothetical protein Z956_05995 [Clostridium botulinum D str. CCUG 7971]KGN00209.1 hypothetical protein Z955_04225 [Clostridium botulinum C/D str. DC5]KOC50826.1 hypothetical protein ADU88_01155 [Clostridium botulinum]KOC51700.1 hypothetical protein ADU89_12920 [Clostridium botulinum]KOC54780.1 hypothetical protein ADU90_12195 [Clostridium botulinum]